MCHGLYSAYCRRCFIDKCAHVHETERIWNQPITCLINTMRVHGCNFEVRISGDEWPANCSKRYLMTITTSDIMLCVEIFEIYWFALFWLANTSRTFISNAMWYKDINRNSSLVRLCYIRCMFIVAHVFCYRHSKYTSIRQDVPVIGQCARCGHRWPREIQVYLN